MNGRGWVPGKLYLQEQVVGGIWPVGSSLQTPSLDPECQAETLGLYPGGSGKPLRLFWAKN